MTRRAAALPLVAATAWAVAALAVLVPPVAAVAAAALWAAAAATALWAMRRPGRVVVVIALAAAAAAGASTTVAFAEPGRAAVAAVAEGAGSVTVTATVTGRADPAAKGEWWFDASASRVEAGRDAASGAVPVRIAVPHGAREDVRIGATLRIRGVAWAPDPGERSALIVRATQPPEHVAAATGVWAILAAVREGLAASALRLPGPGAALIPGLAVGDTAAVGPDVEEAMRAASLTHLTAVSGANCAIVVGLAFGLAALCGAPRGLRVGAGLGTLALFVLLVTPEPSVVRAAAMAAVAMLAVALGRTAAGAAVLAVAVAVLLIVDPWLALSMGFALSAIATASLLVLARPLAAGLSRILPAGWALAVSVPLAAQIACAPLLVLLDPAVPLLGVAANLLAAPAAPLATVAGFFACLAAPLPPVQDLLVATAWLPAAWIAGVAETIAAVPGQRIPWPDGLGGAAALAVTGAAVVVAVAPWQRAKWARAFAVGLLAIVAGVAGGQAALSGVVAAWTSPSAWQIAVCDVGQGDAVLLRSRGAVALVDTGPDPGLLRACLDRFGVGRIDLLVLTHFDADHSGGVDAVMGRAGLVLHGPPDADGARELADLSRAGAEVRRAGTGDSGTLGAARWQVLWPAGSVDAPGNDASVVLHVSGPDLPAVLLLGDLSAEPQARLRAVADARGAEVVKVAHHGSADQDPRLYTDLGAVLALIPVGADNDYGHPRPRLLEVLRATGAVVARTDRDGAIAVWRDDAGLRVWREHPVAPAD